MPLISALGDGATLFWWLHSIQLCGFTITYLSSPFLVDISVVSNLLLSQKNAVMNIFVGHFEHV